MIALVYQVVERTQFYFQNRDVYRNYDDVRYGVVENYIKVLHEHTDHDKKIRSCWIWMISCAFGLVTYLALCGWVFSAVNNETWLRGFYLMVQTITGNSFGDVYPESQKAVIWLAVMQLSIFFLGIPLMVFIIMLPGEISTLKDRLIKIHYFIENQ